MASFIAPGHAMAEGYGPLSGSLRSRGTVITAVLSALAGLLHMSCRHACSLPALTLSFNICMLGFLLTLTDNRSDLTELGWGAWDDEYSPDDGVDPTWIEADLSFFHDATIRGVGQFMFVGNTVGAWLVVIGIAVTSRRAACAAVLGSFVACVTCRYLFDLPPSGLVAVHNGLYGYCAAGACVAMGGGVFYQDSVPALFIGMVGAMLAVFIHLAVEAALINDNLSLPALTIPFVISTWLMMLSRSAWLDPKTEDGEDMDDVLFKNKNRKRKRGAEHKKPVADDPNEKWNTRDKSQIDRRDNVKAVFGKPFKPLIRKLSDNKLLRTEKMLQQVFVTHEKKVEQAYSAPEEDGMKRCEVRHNPFSGKVTRQNFNSNDSTSSTATIRSLGTERSTPRSRDVRGGGVVASAAAGEELQDFDDEDLNKHEYHKMNKK